MAGWYQAVTDTGFEGRGMTSQRTRKRLIQRLRERGITNEQVLQTMEQVPRHLFIDEALASRAYDDVALPIDAGQTISQPYTVALMTQLLMQVKPLNRVLEVGTGSGYQAAILSHLVKEVYTLERIRHLYLKSRQRLKDLQYNNVYCRHSDGAAGWVIKAPFDAIIVTAAAAAVPETLLAQLREGGLLVIPVGEQKSSQQLWCLEKTEEGLETRVVENVVFVPMIEGTTD